MAHPNRTAGSDPTGPDASVQALVDHLLARHGGDPRAVWEAMNGPGGYIDQILAAGGSAPPGAAFGLDTGGQGTAADIGGPWFGRLVPERRFTLPEPPHQVSTLRVRIDIDEARPPIWRRLELAGDLTLSELDLVIQAAFGWLGSHLHMFVPEIDGTKDLRVRPFPNEGTDEFCDDSLPREGLVRLDQLVRKEGDRLFYEYDFGDSWHHTLKVEKVLPRSAGDPRAVCVGGRRAGPPEDVGGIWRYNDVVAALAGDESAGIDEEEMAELRDWLGEYFDPQDPGLDELDLDGLLGTHGATALWAALLPGNPRLAPHCAELVKAVEPLGLLPVLASKFTAAGLNLTAEPPAAARASVIDGLTEQEAEAVLLPWRTFLSAIGPDGAQLTAAGYLRPALVETLFASLGMDDEWIGKGNREDQTLPVARLRRAATTVGLVRKHKGRLLPTKAVAGTADPIRLWRHVADHLTRGHGEYERQCAVLALLVIAGDGAVGDGAVGDGAVGDGATGDGDGDAGAGAAGDGAMLDDPIGGARPPSVVPATAPGEGMPVQEAFRQFASEMLGRLGWRRGDRPPGGWDAWHSAEAVWVAFDHPACITSEGRVTLAGRRLAQAALLAG